MTFETVLLSLLTVLLVPWVAWSSKVLISIQVQLARNHEKVNLLKTAFADHETRLRTLESDVGGRRKFDRQ